MSGGGGQASSMSISQVTTAPPWLLTSALQLAVAFLRRGQLEQSKVRRPPLPHSCRTADGGAGRLSNYWSARSKRRNRWHSCEGQFMLVCTRCSGSSRGDPPPTRGGRAPRIHPTSLGGGETRWQRAHEKVAQWLLQVLHLMQALESSQAPTPLRAVSPLMVY